MAVMVSCGRRDIVLTYYATDIVVKFAFGLGRIDAIKCSKMSSKFCP